MGSSSEREQAVLREACPECGFHFLVMDAMPSSFAVFKDAPETEQITDRGKDVVDAVY